MKRDIDVGQVLSTGGLADSGVCAARRCVALCNVRRRTSRLVTTEHRMATPAATAITNNRLVGALASRGGRAECPALGSRCLCGCRCLQRITGDHVIRQLCWSKTGQNIGGNRKAHVSARRATMVLTPTTAPRPSITGPPELPGFSAASICR